MNQIYEISFCYYVHFYSYKGKVSTLWPWIITTFISSAVFIFLSVGFLINIDRYKDLGLLLYWEMRFLFVSEISFLLLFYRVKIIRDKIVTEGYQNFSKKQQIIMAKRKWIKLNTDNDEKNYFQFAKDIKEIHELHKKYSSRIWSFSEFFSRYIYSPDSSSRITSYFIFLMSIVSILSIKSLDDVKLILPILEDSSYHGFLVILMIFMSFVFFIWIGFLYLVRFFLTALDTTISILTSSKRSSYRFVEVFVSDLIDMHRLSNIKCNKNKGK